MSGRTQQAAIVVARWARDQIPLYRDLYAKTPVETWPDFRRLPVLTPERLRGTPLVDQVDTLGDVLRAQSIYVLQSAVTPRTLVLDSDDTDAAFDQTRAAFALAGVRKGTRLTLLAAPAQRYVAAEMADQLGYFGIETHLVIALDAATTARSLAMLAPDCAVALGVDPIGDAPRWITVRQAHGAATDLYVVPEAGVVAVRRTGETDYRVLRHFCLLESDAEGGLLFTALRRYHQPLIRFQLHDRGRLTRGRLCLDEVMV